MTGQVKAVVEAFERLTPDEQIEAYLAIEELWKEQQDDGAESNVPTHQSPE
jgi:hypothetical protein